MPNWLHNTIYYLFFGLYAVVLAVVIIGATLWGGGTAGLLAAIGAGVVAVVVYLRAPWPVDWSFFNWGVAGVGVGLVVSILLLLAGV